MRRALGLVVLVSALVTGAIAFSQPSAVNRFWNVYATKATGPSIYLAGDAGVRFGDGTVLNSATIPAGNLPTSFTANTITGSSGSVVTLNSSLAAGGGTSTGAFQIISTINQGTTDRVFRVLNNTSTEVLSSGGDGTLRTSGNVTVNGGGGQVNANTLSGGTVTTVVNTGADGASAIGVKIRTGSAYANAAAKIASFQNNTTEKQAVDLNGAQIQAGVTFANIATGSTANGTLLYCSDCTIANPCNSGGSGAFAKRLNGSWICN